MCFPPSDKVGNTDSLIFRSRMLTYYAQYILWPAEVVVLVLVLVWGVSDKDVKEP